MLRPILAVIAGYAVWTVIWLTGGVTLFPESSKAAAQGEPVTDTGVLVRYLILSVVCSAAAGVVARLVGGKKGMAAAIVTAVLLLLTGIGVQAGVWRQMPFWYHLTFLILLVPVTLVGARLVPRKRPA